MKKISLFLGALLLLSGHIWAGFGAVFRAQSEPNHKLSALKSYIRSKTDAWGSGKLYGDRAVSEHNKQFIMSVIHQARMSDYCIEIRSLSNKNYGYHPIAFVMPSLIFGGTSHALLYVNEAVFELLSVQEKRAVIQRELMHLKMNHGLKRGALHAVCGTAFGYGLFKVINNINLAELKGVYSAEFQKAEFLVCCQVLGWLLVGTKYHRMCEYAADDAVAKSGNKAGLQLLLQRIKNHEFDDKASFVQELFELYPTTDDRIAALES